MTEIDGTIFFFSDFVHCPLSNFLNKQDISEAGSLSIFRYRST